MVRTAAAASMQEGGSLGGTCSNGGDERCAWLEQRWLGWRPFSAAEELALEVNGGGQGGRGGGVRWGVVEA
jgi:hypothetical protein